MKDDDPCSLFLDTGLQIPFLSRGSMGHYPPQRAHVKTSDTVQAKERERERERKPPQERGNWPASGQIRKQQHPIAGETKGQKAGTSGRDRNTIFPLLDTCNPK
jgi:hypothetical protein